MANSTKRSLAWEWLGQPGLEYLLLNEDEAGVKADGWIVAVLDGQVVKVRYTVECAAGWRFRRLELDLEPAGEGKQRLAVQLDSAGSWSVNGQPRSDLTGCTDIDIMVTPFTNTLPLRNLGLQVNQPRSIRVAYIRFPDLDVSPVDQEYTRLDPAEPPRRFRYHSLASGFVADLTVDRDGLVIDYPGIWRQISL